MKLYEKIIVGFLIIVSFIMIWDLYIEFLFPNLDISFNIGWDLFPFIFYVFAIGVPIYFFIKWLLKKDKYYLYASMISTIPFILFIIWLFFALSALGGSIINM